MQNQASIETVAPTPHLSQGDKWVLLIAMLVYAAGISAYVAISMGQIGSRQTPGYDMELLFAAMTFFGIVAYALGFMLLAAVLDVLTMRRAQPLSALSLALAALSTLELLRLPLSIAYMRLLGAVMSIFIHPTA